jgi:hypothetical protein
MISVDISVEKVRGDASLLSTGLSLITSVVYRPMERTLYLLYWSSGFVEMLFKSLHRLRLFKTCQKLLTLLFY